MQLLDGMMNQGANDHPHEGNTENWKRNKVGQCGTPKCFTAVPENSRDVLDIVGMCPFQSFKFFIEG